MWWWWPCVCHSHQCRRKKILCWFKPVLRLLAEPGKQEYIISPLGRVLSDFTTSSLSCQVVALNYLCGPDGTMWSRRDHFDLFIPGALAPVIQRVQTHRTQERESKNYILVGFSLVRPKKTSPFMRFSALNSCNQWYFFLRQNSEVGAFAKNGVL